MAFAQKIAGMRPAYLDRAVQRFAGLRDRLAEAGTHAEAAAELPRALHDLAGTAPVFGLIDLGTTGRQLEARLLADADAIDVPVELDAILTQLHAARAQCE